MIDDTSSLLNLNLKHGIIKILIYFLDNIEENILLKLIHLTVGCVLNSREFDL